MEADRETRTEYSTNEAPFPAEAGIWHRNEMQNGQVFKTQLNFQNITDEEYYPRASDQSIVHPGAPLSVVGSIGYEF